MAEFKMASRSPFGGDLFRQPVSSGSSSVRARSEPPEVVKAKMEAFRKIKPICVELLGIASSPPITHSRHAALLDALHQALVGAPRLSFTPSMISYILFPVTSALRHSTPTALPDRYLESVFRLLSEVVSIWKGIDGGLDIQAWGQLWRFTSAAVGPRVGDKGKAREVGQEAQLQAVHLLDALLSPTPGYPTEAMKQACGNAKARLMPTLFQTVTLLLETTSPSRPHRQLQLASLRLLRTCLSTYLDRQHNVLASLMPGGISRMARLVQTEGPRLKGEVAESVVKLLQTLVVLTLNDKDLRSLGVLRPKVDNLSQLADEWVDSKPEHVPPSPAPSTNSLPADPFPPLTASYLEYTSTQVNSALQPILDAFVDHPSDLARRACVELCFALVDKCHGALPQMGKIAMRTLLLSSQDQFDSVRDAARSSLGRLSNAHAELRLDETLVDLLSEAMNGFPRHIKSYQDDKVVRDARLITALSDLFQQATQIQSSNTRNVIAELLGPAGRVERWSWALLDCLELGRPAGWSAVSSTASRAAQLGWKDGLIGANLLTNGDDDGMTPAEYPILSLRYIERESTNRSLTRMLAKLGAAGGDQALFSIEYFAKYARSHQTDNIAKAVSALWVAQHILDGIASTQIENDEGKISRATRKMAREMTKMIVAMDDEEDVAETVEAPTTDSDTLVPVERGKGIDAITTLLDNPVRNMHATAETRRLHAEAQRTLVTCLSLSTLALTSRILSSSFRPLLLTVLYKVLSNLASPQPLIAQYAEITLAHIAYHTGYASARNLVLDNVDYVINVVSQRLTHHRLSTSAPLVLIAMIRLVGAEIVPQVHDVVDEIFDALDDFHGYEVLTSSLLAVLVTLMDVMADEIKVQGPSLARSERLKEWDRIERPPNPVTDFGKLFEWHGQRDRDRSDQVEAILERAPQQAWAKPDADADDDAAPPPDPEEVPPTRSEEVCKAILDKAVNFLSHRSPFLRARILALLARATVVLAAGNREQDLLPCIDRAWSLILLRLDDEIPYVVTEAAEVVATLCEETGDFMSRRILEHAWPRLQKLLERQQSADSKSALARKGSIGTESAFTVSHRLHLAVLRIAQFIAAKIPVSSAMLWEMMVLFRPMLDARAHEEVQQAAMAVYLVLGSRDGDALWAVIRSTLTGEGAWGWLGNGHLQVQANMEQLLLCI